MKKLKKVLIVVGVLYIVYMGFLYAMNQYSRNVINMTKEEKLEEFAYLNDIIDQTYPFLAEVQDAGVDIKRIRADYKMDIAKTRNDIDYFNMMAYYVKEFKGLGHMSLVTPKAYKDLDMIFSYATDNMDTDIVARFEYLKGVLYNKQSAELYGMLDNTSGRFRSKKGLKKEILDKQSIETGTNDTLDSRIVTRDIEEGIAYVSIPGFSYNQKEGEELLSFFKEKKDYKDIIIDIRGNGGGSDIYWENYIVAPNIDRTLSMKRYFLFNKNELTKPFINSYYEEGLVYDINKLPKQMVVDDRVLSRHDSFLVNNKTVIQSSNDGHKGKLWVLTNGVNYSASENFVMFCKETGFATTVGSRTNGDGGAIDPIFIKLPNSGMIIKYSMLYGLNPDGSGNEAYGTLPDINTKDDDALEKCLEVIRQSNEG